MPNSLVGVKYFSPALLYLTVMLSECFNQTKCFPPSERKANNKIGKQKKKRKILFLGVF